MLIEKAQKTQNCTIAIAEGRADELMRELRAHRLDLVISNSPPPVSEVGLYARSIAKMPVVVCGTRKFAHLKRDFPASLEGAPFVLPTAHNRLRQDIDHYLKLQGQRLDVIVEVQDTALQKLLAAHGAGVTVIAEPAAKEMIENKELILLGALPGVFEELWLIAGERKIANPVAAKLMKSFSL